MIIVRMLSGSPKNGVELMDEIEKMTQGWWRPSPGSIYPMLDQLVTEDLVKKRDDGRYELTEKAQTELEWSFGPSFRKPRSLDDMVKEVSGFVSYLDEMVAADPKAAQPYKEKIGEMADRLASIVKKQKE